MANLSLIALEVCLLFCRARLLAHYRLWDFWGEVLYDFAGLQNHARVLTQSTSDIVLTDRGLYLSKSQIFLPDDLFDLDLGPEESTALISFWYLPLKSSRLITLDGKYGLVVDLEIFPKYILLTYIPDRATFTHAVQKEMSNTYLDSWTHVMFQISLKGGKVNIKIFL